LSHPKEKKLHTRYLISNNVYFLIIDGGSSANVASARVVGKLGLKTIPNAKPRNLHG